LKKGGEKMDNQQLILVDEQDKFLGKYAAKADCHSGQGLHHRAFTIMILNSKNEVLLQKRKHSLWDGYWDLTNSHPLHLGENDETYEQAALRCLKREWGVEFPVKKLFGFNYFSQYGDFCENEYCAFMLGEYDGEVYPNPEVAYGYKWISLKDLLADVKKNQESYTPWAVRALEEYEKRFIH